MYSVNSQAGHDLHPFSKRTFIAIVVGCCFALPLSAQSQTTIVDSIEINNRPAIVSGEVITDRSGTTSETAAPSTAAGEVADNLNYTEYQFGESTVREYKNGDTLLYIEILNKNGTSYVINHVGGKKPEEIRKKSGFVITRW